MSNWGPKRVAKCVGMDGGPRYFGGDEESRRFDWKLSCSRDPYTARGQPIRHYLSFFTSYKMKLIDVIVDGESQNDDIMIWEVRSEDLRYPDWLEIGMVFVRSPSRSSYVAVEYMLEETHEVERDSSPREQASTPLSTLSADFEKLFLSPTSSDLTIVIGSEEIPAHKVILSTRLQYFERLFASGLCLLIRVEVEGFNAGSGFMDLM